MNIQQIDLKIKALEEKKKQLLSKQENNSKVYIYLDKFKCWILPEVILKNKTYDEQKAEIPSGCEIASYEIIQYCRNNNLHKCFIDFWVHVPNPDRISEKNYVARFDANSGRADLGCNGDPTDTYPSLGVFVVRKRLKEIK